MATIAEDTSRETITTNAQESEFTRANVEALGTNNVRLVETDENGLSLFCYVNCGPEDSELVKQCRGVVFHNDTLVMKGFPYTREFSHEDSDELNSLISDISNCVCYDSHEGVLIRVFYFGDKWYTSTHRRLDAFRSKWASRESFGQAFLKALESEASTNPAFKSLLSEDPNSGIMEKLFTEVLDQSKQYMFLVRNSADNRIVCAPPEVPTLYHVGTFVDGVLDIDCDIGIRKPVRHSFDTVIEMQDYVYSCNPRDLQGVIVFMDGDIVCKVVNKTYLSLFNVRGNEPSVKYRYLQVRMDNKLNDKIRYLYPEFVPIFDSYEDSIYDLAQLIHTAYVKRYVRKQYITMPHEEFAVMKACHQWYEREKGSGQKVTLNKVIEVLNSQPPTKVNHMLRRLTTEQLKKNESQQETETRQRSNTIECTPPSLPVPGGPLLTPLLLSKKRE